MQQKVKDIQNQYEGFLKTPTLWNGKDIYGIDQFKIEQKSHVFNSEIDSNQRLGKYIERFVSFQLTKVKSIKTISENVQIQKVKVV